MAKGLTRILVAALFVLAAALAANAVIPKKVVCLGQYSTEPVRTYDVTAVFEKCIAKCATDNTACVEQCVDLVRVMSDYAKNIGAGGGG